MPTVKMVISSDLYGAVDGQTHLQGPGMMEFETLCGFVGTINVYREEEGKVTCPGCQDTVRTVLAQLPKRQRASLFKKICGI